MWVCYFDLDYALEMGKVDKDLEAEGKETPRRKPFSVGYYKPKGDFLKWDQFERIEEAEAKVHYLNGGARG